MRKDELERLLREEEVRRRAAVKQRDHQILQLVEEQKDDDSGKLWGEKSFHDLPQVQNGEWFWDVVGTYRPEKQNPERLLLLQEVFVITSQTIRSQFGETAWLLFLDWLHNTTVAELALEQDVTFTSLLRQIKAMVAACRKRMGTKNPDAFPFEEKSGGGARKVNLQRGYRRMMSGKSEPANEAARVYLSDSDRSMSVDELWEILKAKGFTISRTTAYRAKLRGWFYPVPQKTFPKQKISLSAEERELPTSVVMLKFGISSVTAKKAKERGFFYITTNNRDLVKIPAKR